MNFKIWLEGFDGESYYAQHEPKLLADPQIRRELEDNFFVSTISVMKSLGIPEGEANFMTRTFNQRRGDVVASSHSARKSQEREALDKDQFLYHVTTLRNLPSIRKIGLVPGMSPQFSNYSAHSKNRIFLTEKGGIEFWKDRVEDHESHNRDRQSRIVVLKVPRDKVQVEDDPVGTRDSWHPSYFSTKPIPRSLVEPA